MASKGGEKARTGVAGAGSDTRRLSANVLGIVDEWRRELEARTGVAVEERAVIEAAIVEGVAVLRGRAKLARAV